MIRKGYALLCNAIILLGSIQASAQATNPLEAGSWLEGIQTRYVSDVVFHDIDFNRYTPYKNPYAAVTHTHTRKPAAR